jgi:hypothetical protein
VRLRTYAQRRSQSGIDVSVAEGLLQSRKCRLARAVAGCDVVNVVSVMQGSGYLSIAGSCATTR